MPTKQEIRAAFALYDTNGDGFLSKAELKAIMCKKVEGGTPRTEEDVDKLVARFDENGDGMLSMEEIATAWATMAVEAEADKDTKETVEAMKESVDTAVKNAGENEAEATEGEKAAAEVMAEAPTEENQAEAPTVEAPAEDASLIPLLQEKHVKAWQFPQSDQYFQKCQRPEK